MTQKTVRLFQLDSTTQKQLIQSNKPAQIRPLRPLGFWWRKRAELNREWRRIERMYQC